ncbi:hypothetical protein MHU86_3379 [Fragilaria crotonensis]|nr:hypothetical protein MHU86_14878 [Fragilaria crotonensis]KAI2511067.1 hypothetical protein MHU86_3379 [Fragilaria crotonensis]
MSTYLSDSDQNALSGRNALHFRAEPDVSVASKTDKTTETITDETPIEGHRAEKPIQITSNMWPRKGTGKEMRKGAYRSSIHGVEMRQLDESHLLAGQTGLFAATCFVQCDIVGEYCGEVVPSMHGREYKAVLEENATFPLGVDSQRYGNECRAINHYENIAALPNVVMKTCYVDQLPRLMIVCKRDIAIGEEFLLDYGDAYVNAFLQGNQGDLIGSSTPISWSEMAGSSTIGDE